MKILIEDDGNFKFIRDFCEHPSVEKAVFSALYLLSKIYPVEEVKAGIIEALNDL